MKKLQIYTVDAFTHKIFHGNPAAVCLLKAPIEKEQKQLIAREINLSETAFVLKENDHFLIEWFTPTDQVDLCGHATLASAHILWEQKIISTDNLIEFQSLSGKLFARQHRDRSISLDFPAKPVIPCAIPNEMEAILGARILDFAENDNDYLALLQNEEEVRDIQPDLERLRTFEKEGIILTAPSKASQYDIISRFFAPRIGIPEDPVTGSAHCALAPYWAEKLQKDSFFAYQASARGGELRVHFRPPRVILQGHAITVMNGQFIILNSRNL